jgi:hypothetical protein
VYASNGPFGLGSLDQALFQFWQQMEWKRPELSPRELQDTSDDIPLRAYWTPGPDQPFYSRVLEKQSNRFQPCPHAVIFPL